MCYACKQKCDANQYQAQRCRAETDTVCAECTTCSTDEYVAVACTQDRNTVCRKITDCASRCRFHDDFGLCWPSNTPVPCARIADQNKCDAHPACIYNPFRRICIDKMSSGSDDNGVVVSGGSCASKSMQSCAGTCMWDAMALVCRDQTCLDIKGATACGASPLDCTYNIGMAVCHAEGQEDTLPCHVYSTPEWCGQEDTRCKMSTATKLCIAATQTTEPCSHYTTHALAACPLDRCAKDVYANVCQDIGVTTPCEAYSQHDTVCPGSPTVDASDAGIKEFLSTPATPSSDAQCQVLIPHLRASITSSMALSSKKG